MKKIECSLKRLTLYLMGGKPWDVSSTGIMGTLIFGVTACAMYLLTYFDLRALYVLTFVTTFVGAFSWHAELPYGDSRLWWTNILCGLIPGVVFLVAAAFTREFATEKPTLIYCITNGLIAWVIWSVVSTATNMLSLRWNLVCYEGHPGGSREYWKWLNSPH